MKKEQHVKLNRLNQYLENNPHYAAAMENVRKTAADNGVSDQALHQIFNAYQEVEQIKADFLCDVGFPVKEKCRIYGN